MRGEEKRLEGRVRIDIVSKQGDGDEMRGEALHDERERLTRTSCSYE